VQNSDFFDKIQQWFKLNS